MKLKITLKSIFRFIGGLFVLGILFFFFAIGQYFIWPIRAVMYPLHTAVTFDWIVVAKVLSYTPLLEMRMRGFPEGCSKPIDIAAKNSSIQMMDILLDRGADINGCTGKNILHIAVENPEMLSHLLEKRKLNPNLKNYYGPPIFATLYRCGAEDKTSLQSLKILLENGADPNITRHKDRMPKTMIIHSYVLGLAAYAGCPEMVEMLLTYGADPRPIASFIRKSVIPEEEMYEKKLNSMSQNNRKNYEYNQESINRMMIKKERAVKLVEEAAAQ